MKSLVTSDDRKSLPETNLTLLVTFLTSYLVLMLNSSYVTRAGAFLGVPWRVGLSAATLAEAFGLVLEFLNGFVHGVIVRSQQVRVHDSLDGGDGEGASEYVDVCVLAEYRLY